MGNFHACDSKASLIEIQCRSTGAIESWTDQQIVASAMQTLGTIFGLEIPDPIDYQITRWASDPLAGGSYSCNTVGATPEMREHLAESLDDALYFAGEATENDYFGTAHGAYLSGLRAAIEMKKQLHLSRQSRQLKTKSRARQ